MSAELVNIGWFIGVVAALALLFAAGLRLPVRIGSASRVITMGLVVGAALIVLTLANVALFRHDAYLDLTREKAFTPSEPTGTIEKYLSYLYWSLMPIAV